MELVQHGMRRVADETRDYTQLLETAKLAKDGAQESFCCDMLVKIQDKRNILTQFQAPGDICHWLRHTGLPVYMLYLIQSKHVCMWENSYTGA